MSEDSYVVVRGLENYPTNTGTAQKPATVRNTMNNDKTGKQTRSQVHYSARTGMSTQKTVKAPEKEKRRI